MPDGIVFDEAHFGNFINHYLNGRYFLDVHPPFVKLVLTTIAALFGYDGTFPFSEVGDSYLDTTVPFIPLRLFSALCGSFTPVVVYWIMTSNGIRNGIAFLTSLTLVFEDSLVTQSRVFMLDSPLCLFIALCIYGVIQVSKYEPNSKPWNKQLCLTGFAIGLALSTKVVGAFTAIWCACYMGSILWVYVGDLDLTERDLRKSGMWCFYFLIVTPFVIYLGFFTIHFALLPHSGEGTSLMSTEFQASVLDSALQDSNGQISFGSTVNIRHWATGAYLHSHDLKYVKSGHQQVSLYAFHDDNNDWFLERKLRIDREELLGRVKLIKHNDSVRFWHESTGGYLSVDDIRPPISEQEYNNEVNVMQSDPDINELFAIKINKDYSTGGGDASKQVLPRVTVFQLIHKGTKCTLFGHNVKLPSFYAAGKQLEVMCCDSPTLENSLWYVEKTRHPILSAENDRLELRPPSLFAKLVDVHRVMFRLNSDLTDPHPESSTPLSWLLAGKGTAYYDSDGLSITLRGNKVFYCVLAGLLCTYTVYCLVALLRNLDPYVFPNYQPSVNCTVSLGWWCCGWFLHWFPFTLMKRQLFLHHYLPCLIFGALCIGQAAEYAASKNMILGYTLAVVFLGLILSSISYSF